MIIFNVLRLASAGALATAFALISNDTPAQSRTIRIESVAPTAPTTQVVRHGITREDVREIQELIPGIERVIIARHIEQKSARVGDRSRDVRVTGTTHDYELADNEKLVRGRLFTNEDVTKRNNIAVISNDVSEKLFANSDPIGRAVGIGREYFTVVGVIEATRPKQVIIPYTTMKSRFGDTVIMTKSGRFEARTYEISEIDVVMTDNESIDRARNLIQQILEKNHEERDYRFTR